MTYATRCQHGELWAVCRECPDDVSPWSRADPLRPFETDEEPWTLERENRERSGLIAAACVLAIAALVVVAYLWGTR